MPAEAERNEQYAERAYWDARYAAAGEYDWFQTYPDLR
jgi:hypothetical protein